MRTTVTLDADTEQLIRRRMSERRMTFKEALNSAIRDGCVASEPTRFRTPTAKLGRSQVNLDRALQLAAELEDDELVRKARSGR
jgi:hypothetical protein